jgi:hypothetical protein
MHITKVFTTTIDIVDCLEQYTNIDVLIMKKLQDRYVKKCHMSMLILSVDKIIRRSSVHISSNRLDGSMYVDVEFAVSGVVFIAGEILHNCKIIEINAQTITAEHPYAIIKLQKTSLPVSDAIFKTLKIDQIIPVIVQLDRYMANKSTATMLATPYVPQPFANIVYSINKPLDDKQIEQLKSLLELVSDEEKKHSSIKDTKSYAVFSTIMYPYLNKQQFAKSKLYETMDLKPIDLNINAIQSISNGCIIYPSEDQPNKRFFHGKGIGTVQASLFMIVSSVVNKYLNYLQALRGFVETYPEGAKHTKELANYLNICQKTKQ